jgi:hypothetical protein
LKSSSYARELQHFVKWKGKLAGLLILVESLKAFRLENTRGNFEARESGRGSNAEFNRQT